MGGMDTFKNNDSVYSHGEESLAMLDEVVKAIKEGCSQGTILISNISLDSIRFVFKHIRESIEAYRDITEELDDDIRKSRSEYEHELMVRENRVYEWANMHISATRDITKELVEFKEKSTQLEQRIQFLTKELEDTELNRDANLKLYTSEREKSNQFEKRCSELIRDRDSVVEYWSRYCEELLRKHREELAAKDREIYEARLQRDKNSASATYWKCKCHELEKAKINNPCNFCGNCRHYAQMGKDDGDFEGICTQYYIKRVDPDDASCSHFESNQVDRDKPDRDKPDRDKPDHPCCKACNRDNCDDCTLCPF